MYMFIHRQFIHKVPNSYLIWAEHSTWKR